MTSGEFIESRCQNRKGKNAGRRTIWFNGRRRDKATGQYGEYTKPRFEEYIATDFRRVRDKIRAAFVSVERHRFLDWAETLAGAQPEAQLL